MVSYNVSALLQNCWPTYRTNGFPVTSYYAISLESIKIIGKIVVLTKKVGMINGLTLCLLIFSIANVGLMTVWLGFLCVFRCCSILILCLTYVRY